MSINVPVGHIIVNDKWNGTELYSTLSKSVKVIGLDSLGVVDFYPSSDIAIVYVTEGDLLTGNDYKRKLVKLRKVKCFRPIAIVERTQISMKYFYNVQKFVVIELGLGILPVNGQVECAQYLAFTVNFESQNKHDILNMESRIPPLQVCILRALCKIPSLGEVKARVLMETFESLASIGTASKKDLEKVIGQASAIQVYNFFHNN